MVRRTSGLLVVLFGVLLLPGTPRLVSHALADGGGNSATAQACQQGGYVNYSRSDGRRFSDTGACVSYVAQGGTLVARVALPDLTVTLTCTQGGSPVGSLHTVSCTFTLHNLGAGPATFGPNQTVLAVTFAVPQGDGNGAFTSATGSPFLLGTFDEAPTRSKMSYITAATPFTLAPGASVDSLRAGVDTATAGQAVTVTATVDSTTVVAEANEANNTTTAGPLSTP
jgi:hypothetical protein